MKDISETIRAVRYVEVMNYLHMLEQSSGLTGWVGKKIIDRASFGDYTIVFTHPDTVSKVIP
jgi:hypothetical protein